MQVETPTEVRTVSLTKANDEGFDAVALQFDIQNMSNVRIYQVTEVVELVNEGHLHYVKLNFIEGEIADPKSDPMIVGTIKRTIEQESTPDVAVSPTQTPLITDLQWRVLWDNKLWRPLDDNATAILEAFCGIKAADVQKFSDKLADNLARSTMVENLMLRYENDPSWSVNRLL